MLNNDCDRRWLSDDACRSVARRPARQALVPGHRRDCRCPRELCRLSSRVPARAFRHRTCGEHAGDRRQCFEHDSADDAARGRLSAQDMQTSPPISGNPSVPSPSLRISTRNAAGSDSTIGLTSAPCHSVRLPRGGRCSWPTKVPACAADQQLRIVGPHAAEYMLVENSCVAAILDAGRSCEAVIAFSPDRRQQRIAKRRCKVDHDWVAGTMAVALLATAETSAANPPVAASGGGGASRILELTFIALVAATRGRSRARRRSWRSCGPVTSASSTVT